jgi:hypothetical protein
MNWSKFNLLLNSMNAKNKIKAGPDVTNFACTSISDAAYQYSE